MKRPYLEPLRNARVTVLQPVLLTGAGFTANFGGFLAEEMWSWVFNDRQIQSRPAVAQKLRESQNYEDVYSIVQTGQGFGEEDRSALTNAIARAYHLQESAVMKELAIDFDTFSSSYRSPISSVSRFVDRFAGRDGGKRGYFFTLNQDLFIERYHEGECELVVPGAPTHISNVRESRKWEFDLDKCHPVTSDVDTLSLKDCEPRAECFHYVKLHGSLNWRSSNGARAMVIGSNKAELIRKELLLQYYLNLFRAVLERPARRVCVIGYGFRDPHINEILATSIGKGGKLYIVSPSPPWQFHERLKHQPRGETIWQGVAGCFPWSLKDIFPDSQYQTVKAEDLENAIFG